MKGPDYPSSEFKDKGIAFLDWKCLPKTVLEEVLGGKVNNTQRVISTVPIETSYIMPEDEVLAFPSCQEQLKVKLLLKGSPQNVKKCLNSVK